MENLTQLAFGSGPTGVVLTKNRENTPSVNDELKLKGKYRYYEKRCGVSVAKRCCTSLILRRNSAANASYVNDGDVVEVLSDKRAQTSVVI